MYIHINMYEFTLSHRSFLMHLYIFTHTCMFTFTPVKYRCHSQLSHASKHYMYVYLYSHSHVHICTCTHIHIHVYMYISIYICTAQVWFAIRSRLETASKHYGLCMYILIYRGISIFTDTYIKHLCHLLLGPASKHYILYICILTYRGISIFTYTYTKYLCHLPLGPSSKQPFQAKHYIYVYVHSYIHMYI